MSTIISVISLFIAAISAMFTGLNLYSNRAVLIKFGEDDRSSPKCWCKLNSANLSFHKLKHTGFF